LDTARVGATTRQDFQLVRDLVRFGNIAEMTHQFGVSKSANHPYLDCGPFA
jgi:hypothetical protein